jgi:hypothetical protein
MSSATPTRPASGNRIWRSVWRWKLDDLVRELRQADQLGTLRNKRSQYLRPHLLVRDLCRHRDYAELPLAPAVNAQDLRGF